MVLNELLLLSKQDIPFLEARVVIHQPTIREIGLIGEEAFFTGCELLNFSKDSLAEEDKNHLVNKTNFDVLMSIMTDRRNVLMQKQILSAKMVLSLIFPNYNLTYKANCINLELIENEDNEIFSIDNTNYENFKLILQEMFCMKKNSKQQEEFDPGGELAKKIANKLKKGREEVNRLKNGGNNKIAIFSRYISILAVGLKKDINSLTEYSVYQLYDEFDRFELKQEYEIYLKLKLAGAKDVKEVDNWMKDIHP